MIIILFAAVGGFLIKLIQGISICGKELNPVHRCFRTIVIPDLVGMIIFGCIARNFFGDAVYNDYPLIWADWLRQVCLSIILMRGGLELDFSGKGITVVLLTLCPQIAEASCCGILAHLFFDMPWALSFALGFCLGAVSPAIIVPSLMILQRAKYGIQKGIPTTMIAASSFDDMIAITVYSVLVTTAFEQIGVGSPDGKAMSPADIIVSNVVQILTGIIVGLIIGWGLRVIDYMTWFNNEGRLWIKFGIMIFMAVFTPVLTHIVHFHEAKYIGIIFFGYACYRSWGENQPDLKLGSFWKLCSPFLFGTVGASVNLRVLGEQSVGLLILVIFLCLIARWLGTFFATAGKFTLKERAFMSFAWIPKATVQAAIGGIALSTAMEAEGLPEDVREEYI